MELVYESSYVTVIAADTDSADGGNPGISVLQRKVNQDRQLLKPGLELLRVHYADRHLQQSKWNTRGWTLQEYYLSRRTITFVNSQAYFRCHQRNWYEDLWSDQEPDLPRREDLDFLTSVRDSMDTGGNNVTSYTFLFGILAIYQGRDLTNENDALNAMAGILQRVTTATGTKIVQGLPADIFPLAILFIHTARRAPQRRKAFPSWSWCGWTGETSWYAFDKLDLMNAADEENDFNEDIEMEGAMSHDWITYYAIEGTGQPEMIWCPADEQNAVSELASFRTLSPGLESIDFGGDATKDNIKGQEARLRTHPLLSFQTLTVHFRLKTIPEGGELEDYDLSAPRPSFRSYKSRTYEIRGMKEDEECGTFYADKRLQNLEDDNVVKFVVLGECYKVEYPLAFDLDESGDDGEEGPLFWVMLIRLIDGVWERRGIGQILRSSLEYSYPPGARWEHVELG